MVDTLVRWATAYKVDGFRFDLMGHHMVANLEHARAALRALTPEHDGVDGATIILYGEGWDFGEVAGSARGRNASQANMAGTGIGTFNDRLRDAARGGGAFSGLQEQGFATGLYHTPNGTPQGSVAEQRARLLEFADRIRVSLAGNLRDLRLVDWQGHAVTGAEIRYGGGAGYTLRPEENVLYVAAHDNETLFDAIQLKAPVEASLADRVRMNNLALSLVLLGQGLPFLHAGDELLRSKSLDRNSYNSGDWFNALDYSATRTGWAAGLPPAGENEPHWPVMAALLANPALAPRREHVLRARAHVEELLRIRRSSRLFRLRTAEAIHAGVAFPQAGPSPAPGVIVLRLSGDDPDGGYSCIVVIVNASTHGHGFVDPELRGRPFALHPVLAASADPVVRRATHYTRHATFWVPARTTAVFVSPPPPAAARAGGLRGRLRQLAALARHGLAALPRRK
jgi:pullulanase-type alpha-1,6-glucosidase